MAYKHSINLIFRIADQLIKKSSNKNQIALKVISIVILC